MKQRLLNSIRSLHNDTRGAMSVEKILILGLIALPIIVILLAFRTTITGWFKDQTSQLTP